jgi:3-hydroxyisobutyrate dehydrogenase
MPVAAAAEQVVQSLVGNGYDDVDFAALLEYQAKASGLDLRPEDAPVSDGLSGDDSSNGARAAAARSVA